MSKRAWLAIAACVVLWGVSLGFTLYETRAERRAAIHRACNEQNKRHDKTIGTLEGVYRTAERKTPAKTAEIEASRAPTLLIINALAPHEDCTARVHRFAPH